MLQTLEVLERDLAVDVVSFGELLDAFPLPSNSANAQVRTGLVFVLVETMLLFDALDAIVIGADHAPRRATGVWRLPCGELLDDAPEDVDLQLRLAFACHLLAFAHLLR